MINLISPEEKKSVRAARANTLLVRYATMLGTLGLLVALVYGFGFWLVRNDKHAVEQKLEAQSAQASTYAAVEKEAETFRQNLAIAKNILNNETSYSTFLTTLASDLPSGTILTNLSIGGVTTTKSGLNLDTRASSYAKVLEMKAALEKSELFENVSIVSASRPDDISKLVGLEGKYPYEASYNVKLSPKATTRPTQ